MSNHEPEEIYPPRGYVLISAHNTDQLCHHAIFATLGSAREAAQIMQRTTGSDINVAVIGAQQRTSWDDGSWNESEVLAKSELVWIPDGEGFYARGTDNRGTYHVERLSNPGEIPSPWWQFRYSMDNGDDECGGFVPAAAAAIERAQDHNTRRVRKRAWADYMRDNDPPTVI